MDIISSGASYRLNTSSVPSEFEIPAEVTASATRNLKALRPDTSLERKLGQRKKEDAAKDSDLPANVTATQAGDAAVAAVAPFTTQDSTVGAAEQQPQQQPTDANPSSEAGANVITSTTSSNNNNAGAAAQPQQNGSDMPGADAGATGTATNGIEVSADGAATIGAAPAAPAPMTTAADIPATPALPVPGTGAAGTEAAVAMAAAGVTGDGNGPQSAIAQPAVAVAETIATATGTADTGQAPVTGVAQTGAEALPAVHLSPRQQKMQRMMSETKETEEVCSFYLEMMMDDVEQAIQMLKESQATRF